jgi:hypothetical protein
MDQPNVKVTDISHLLGEELPLNKQVHLGNPNVDARVNTILTAAKGYAKHAYLLNWEGNKVPRGAVVGDETLAWTQNGCAHNQSGQIVGTYDRVVEFGGDSGKEQVMIVYMP